MQVTKESVRAQLRSRFVASEPGRGDLLALIGQGYEAFYREIFGSRMVESWDSHETLDCHHTEAVKWHWESRLALLNNQRPPDDYFVYFPTWARGNMKTTIGRAMLITDAMLTYAHDEQGYALIPGGTKKKIKGTAVSLETMLNDPKVVKYCPELSQVDKNIYGHSKGWTADFIKTKAGYVFHFIGLDEGVAGANVEDVRPTFIMPDDIDSREDSPVVAESRFHIFTSEILPARQQNTLVYWAQNLISRFSVRYRIEKQYSKVLTNRKVTEPIPAVRDLVIEERNINGIIKDVVVSGKPTWRIWNLQRVQDEIDTYGLDAFNRECQHDVEQSNEGIIIKSYDDAVHPISESEFASIYGKDKWKDWYKVAFNDWARTKTKFHANVAGYMAVASQNEPIPGLQFIIPLSFKAGSQPEDIAERLLSILTPIAYDQTTWKDLINEAWQRLNPEHHFETVLDRVDYLNSYYKAIIPKYAAPVLSAYKVKGGVMSHSEDVVRSVFNDGFGFSFIPSNPRKVEAIEKINTAFKVDYDSKHPFRDQPGYTRTFIICPDDLSATPTEINGVMVYPPTPYKDEMRPDNLHDSDLCRYQCKNWRWRDPKMTELGEYIDDPLKMDDDFGQSFQMIFKENLLANIALNVAEKVLIEMDAIMPKPHIPPEQPRIAQAEFTNRAKLATEIKKRLESEDDITPSFRRMG